MTNTEQPTRSLNWFLILVLGVFALLRPLVRIIASQADVDVPAVVPALLTLGITVVWVAVVVSSRAESPVLTLVLAGVTYAVLAMLLSGVLSPILDGELDGPLANPVAIVPVLLVNALWGLTAGGLALLLLRARRR
ncbi:MAG: hypothetical protein ACTH1D_10350 [Mycobacteriaceae bacterium]|uniref:hypothetical protein n=1 Tax=Corynebacterium sp. TaxID=1720 RepID=UPI003F953DDF